MGVSGPAPLAQKKGAAPHANKSEPEASPHAAAGTPLYVQAMVQAQCAACAAEEPPVQAWSVDEIGGPSSDDQPVQPKCAACAQEEERAVQAKRIGSTSRDPDLVQRAARQGLRDASQPLPHAARIQQAFGRHDISHVRVAIGGPAMGAGEQMGAIAFTSGDRIGFREAPDLRLAAHEAAHVIQQRAGLTLPGGVGRAGDRWERHADRVADAVVGGRSAEPLLDEVAESGAAEITPPVQRQIAAPSQRLHEPWPLPPELPAASETDTAPASEGEAAEEASEAEAPAIEEAAAGDAAEAPPEGVTEGAAPAAEAELDGGGGALEAPCYNVDPPPRPDDAPEPTSDERSTETEDEADVTFEAWPDEVDTCQAEDDIAEGGAQAAAQTHALAEAAPNADQAGAAPGPAAASSAAETAPPGDGGEGSASPEVRQMSTAASTAEDQGVAHASAMEGAIASAEAERGTAWTDYYGSLGVLDGAAARAPRLAQGISFGERGEPAARELRAFMAGAAVEIARAIAFAQAEVPARLGGLADAMNANIAATMEVEKQAISARITQARVAALAGAESARAHVEAEYAASVTTVDTETLTAIATLDAEHETALAQIAEKEALGLDDVNTRFAAGRRQHEAKGPEYTKRATTRAEEHVTQYDRCKAGPGNEWVKGAKDGFWDGYLTVRRAKAQQDAARSTAAGYEKGFLRTANKKGYDLKELRKQYRCAVISGAREITGMLDSTHEQLVAGLESARVQALAGLTAARAENLAAIDASLTSILRALSAQELTQRQAVNDTGYLQQLAIERLAHASAAALARGIGSAVDSLDEVLGSLRERVARGGAPDPEALAAALADMQARLGGGMEMLLATMEQGAADAEARAAELGLGALDALLGITESNDEQASRTEAGFARQMGALMEGASRTFGELTASHVSQCQDTATQGVEAMQQAVAGFEQALSTIGVKVDEAIASSLGELETQLAGDLRKIDRKIASEAWKAAEREQPAWKEIVAIVLVVLVIIAAAVISIVTLGAGASLFAIVLVGAIVGALSAGLIQIINNWASGQEWHEGVGQAMVIGAIGGAIGGGIGFGAGGLAAAAGTAGARAVTQLAITVGGDLVAEGLTQVAGYALFGQEFNWEGFLTAGAMSGVSFRPTPARPRVARPASAPHATPDVPHARPSAPDAPTTRPASTDTPAPSPRARAAALEMAGSAGAAMGLEALMAWAGDRDFNLTNAFSSAAGAAIGARMSRRAATTGPGAPTPEPTTRTGRALDRLRRFAPGGLGKKLEGGVERLGGRLGAGEPPGPSERPRGAEVEGPQETPPRLPADADPDQLLTSAGRREGRPPEAELAAEHQYIVANADKLRPSSVEGFDVEIELPNGHTYRRGACGWRRFSGDGTPIVGPDGRPPLARILTEQGAIEAFTASLDLDARDLRLLVPGDEIHRSLALVEAELRRQFVDAGHIEVSGSRVRGRNLLATRIGLLVESQGQHHLVGGSPPHEFQSGLASQHAHTQTVDPDELTRYLRDMAGQRANAALHYHSEQAFFQWVARNPDAFVRALEVAGLPDPVVKLAVIDMFSTRYVCGQCARRALLSAHIDLPTSIARAMQQSGFRVAGERVPVAVRASAEFIFPSRKRIPDLDAWMGRISVNGTPLTPDHPLAVADIDGIELLEAIRRNDEAAANRIRERLERKSPRLHQVLVDLSPRVTRAPAPSAAIITCPIR